MTEKKILIAPSILSCDFGRLLEEAKAVERSGADWLHIDVMDGHFVPNITIGPCIVSSLKNRITIPLDVHLMISQPERYIKDFANAGSDIITFHIEAIKNPEKIISKIRSFGIKAGVSIKPKTKIKSVEKILNKVDLVLVMTVEPGFSGQDFIEGVLPKIKRLRKIFDGDIEVDGGVNSKTAKKVIEAGANVLVAGTSIFGKKDYKEAIKILRG